MRGYWELAKPRITLLVGFSTMAGFLAAARGTTFARGAQSRERLIETVAGAMLVAAAVGCLNQFMERKEDALMLRTRSRPLPRGEVPPSAALAFGLGCALLGSCLLAWRVNAVSCFLTVFTLASYLLVYTPSKKKTPLSTWIGAIPGAMPPLIGWTAAGGALDAQAGTLYAIQFLWQIPHFLALAWIHRRDYARAGFQVYGVVDPSGRSTVRQSVASLVLLFPVSLIPYWTGSSGSRYFLGAAALGLSFLAAGMMTAGDISERSERRLFRASLLYLPCLLMLRVLG